MNRGVNEASATESLIERLKAATMGFDWADLPDDAAIPAVPLLREAAAELETLRSRCERMEEALKPFAEVADWYDDSENDDFEVWQDYPHGLIKPDIAKLKHFRAAARALQQGGKAE